MRIWEWSRPAGYCCTGRQVYTSVEAWALFVSTSQMVFATDGAVKFVRLGSGKTMIAGAMAAELAELGVTYYRISAPEIVSGMSGESEKEIREIFAEAKGNPQGADGMAEFADSQLDSVVESAEECPGECIYIEP